MPNFDYIRPPTMWVPGSVLLAPEIKKLSDDRPALINARDGSTHAPTTQIILAGQGLWVSGPSRLDNLTQGTLNGTFTVSATNKIVVASTADIEVQSGATITVKSGGAAGVESGGLFVLASGSTITGDVNSVCTWSQQAPFTFSGGTWPLLYPARDWERHSLDIFVTTYVGNGPNDAHSWIFPSDVGAGVGMLQTFANTTSTGTTWILFSDLPDGGTFSQVEVSCLGTVGTNPTLPAYQIFRWKDGLAAESMSASTTDTHTPAGNWLTTILTTTITVNANATIDKSFHYGLRIAHPYQAASTASFKVYDIVATGTAADIRL